MPVVSLPPSCSQFFSAGSSLLKARPDLGGVQRTALAARSVGTQGHVEQGFGWQGFFVPQGAFFHGFSSCVDGDVGVDGGSVAREEAENVVVHDDQALVQAGRLQCAATQACKGLGQGIRDGAGALFETKLFQKQFGVSVAQCFVAGWDGCGGQAQPKAKACGGASKTLQRCRAGNPLEAALQ